jgi:hypothetical protein
MKSSQTQKGSTVGMVLLGIGVAGVLVVAGWGLYKSSQQSKALHDFDRNVHALQEKTLSEPDAHFTDLAQSTWALTETSGEAQSPWGSIEFFEPTKGERIMAFDVPFIACPDTLARLEHRTGKLVISDQGQGTTTIIKDLSAPIPVKFSISQAVEAWGLSAFRLLSCHPYRNLEPASHK